MTQLTSARRAYNKNSTRNKQQNNKGYLIIDMYMYKHIGLFQVQLINLILITDQCKLKSYFARLPRMSLIACFTTHGTAWHRLHIFTRSWHQLQLGSMISRASHRLLGFPRLTPVAYFPTLDTGWLFTRAWHRLHVFARSTPVAWFPALDTGCTISRACQRLFVFPALGASFMFLHFGFRRL